MKTLKETVDAKKIMLEVSEKDQQNIAQVFKQIHGILGDIDIPSVENALAEADKILTTKKRAIAMPQSNKALSELILLQTMLVKAFQGLPLMIYKFDRKLASQIEKDIKSGKLSTGEIVESKQTKNKILSEIKAIVVRNQIGKSLGKATKDVRWKKEFDDAMAELDIRPQGQGLNASISNEEARTIAQKFDIDLLDYKGKLFANKKDKKKETGNSVAETPMRELLGDKNERARTEILNLIKPEGWLNKLVSFFKGSAPLGLEPHKFADDLLNLSYLNFVSLLKRIKGSNLKVGITADDARNLAQQTDKLEKSEKQTRAVQGQKINLDKLSTQLVAAGLDKKTVSAITDQFKKMGKGPYYFE